jgi:murein DD-endopeptidase MepM/ murein hydrolase activator NlpD
MSSRNPARPGPFRARAILRGLAITGVAMGVTVCGDPVRPADTDDHLLVPPEPSRSHGGFNLSSGIYRIRYVDGTGVSVWQDHHTHGGDDGPKDRIDLNAGTGAQIVAAAGGWIRHIRDHNGNTFGRGDGLAHDSVTVQDDNLEHACGNNNPDPEADPPDPPNPIVGTCGQYNNYVWIEHPNGEWTKYTHFGTGTVTIDNGWEVGDWVNAGEVLGLEDDIGQATGTPNANHLHFEVAIPNDPNAATLPLTGVKGGFINLNLAQNLVPITCDDTPNLYIYSRFDVITANACDHLPPIADAGGPYVVDEGTLLVLDGTASSDPEGRPLAYRWEPVAFLVDDNRLAQTTFVAGTSMVVDVTLTVYDQMEAIANADNTTITVNNVAPTVAIDPGQVTVIDENQTVTVMAEFTDPGFLDTHTATIDWGVPAGLEGIELAAATIQVLDAGGPGVPLRGSVTGTYRYGDNDDGTGFAIMVTVTDSDGGSGSDSFSLTVHNVDPTAAIDPSGTVLLNGIPTVVAVAGEDIAFEGAATDPGSDDLTLAWDWGDGTMDSRLSLVAPPLPDPLPSPTVQPRLEVDQASHAFAEACLYQVSFTATDDDDGAGSATVDVLVVGTADLPRSAGYWTSEYRFTKNPDFSVATLQCYLDMVNHASGVFSETRTLASFDDATDILWIRGPTSADDNLDRQLLALWLNVANGAYALAQLVDTTGNGMADTTILQVLEAAEALRNDPARTAAEVEGMKDLLEALNAI